MSKLYASDLDRTLIFSNRFLKEYEPKSKYNVIEKKDDKVISYMADSVKNMLITIGDMKDTYFVPVTTRSIEEFSRIELPKIYKYAIVSNGGIILEDGKPMDSWEEYISDKIDRMTLINVAMDMEELTSVGRASKFIDGRYIFNKTNNADKFDIEIQSLKNKYPTIEFTRQRNKVYAIPKCFSKAIALRWLQHKLLIDKTIAVGDSELDLPMLAIADYALIPKHGTLVTDNIVTDGRILEPGIECSLQVLDILNSI